jgi:hypothetical protein
MPRDVVVEARFLLDTDPSLAAYILRDDPRIEAAGLTSLCWSLAGGNWGCCKNDVIGVIELLEKYERKVGDAQ